MTIDALLKHASDALDGALHAADEKARLAAITRFMRTFGDLAKEISAGHGSWDDVRPWAHGIAERVLGAREALGDWQLDIGRLFYDPTRDEVDAEAALLRRSQQAWAREAFSDTAVDALLAEFEDPEVDREFRAEADRIALDPPEYAPASHTWWRRR
jgi:hypothetical protein